MAEAEAEAEAERETPKAQPKAKAYFSSDFKLGTPLRVSRAMPMKNIRLAPVDISKPPPDYIKHVMEEPVPEPEPEPEPETEQRPEPEVKRGRTRAQARKSTGLPSDIWKPLPEYIKQVEESEGFDVPYAFCHAISPILPVNLNRKDREVDKLPRFCGVALKYFNKQYSSRYQIVKLVKVNRKSISGSGTSYYVTFEAKNSTGKGKGKGKGEATNPIQFEAKLYVRRVALSAVLLVRPRGDRRKQVGPFWLERE